MTTGQKIAASLLITVFVSSALTAAFSAKIIPFVETHVYQKTVVQDAAAHLTDISCALEEYTNKLRQTFSVFANSAAVKLSMLPEPQQTDILERNRLTRLLLAETDGLRGIALTDNSNRVCFSTFSQDVPPEIPCSTDRAAAEKNNEVQQKTPPPHSIFFDSVKNQQIYSLPLYDSYSGRIGTALFYVAAEGFSRFLADKMLINISDAANIAAIGAKSSILPTESETEENGQEAPLAANSKTNTQYVRHSTGGFVIGLPSIKTDILISQIEKYWEEGASAVSGTEHLDGAENSSWILISNTSFSEGIVAQIFPENMISLSGTEKMLLLIGTFITLYLIVFLLFSIKPDDFTVIRRKIKKLQTAFLADYFEKKEQYNWEEISHTLELRKQDMLAELKKSFRCKSKNDTERIDMLLDRSWNDMLSIIKNAPHRPPDSINQTENAYEDIPECLEIIEEADQSAFNQETPAKTLQAETNSGISNCSADLENQPPQIAKAQAENTENATLEAADAENVYQTDAAQTIEKCPQMQKAEESASSPTEAVPADTATEPAAGKTVQQSTFSDMIPHEPENTEQEKQSEPCGGNAGIHQENAIKHGTSQKADAHSFSAGDNFFDYPASESAPKHIQPTTNEESAETITTIHDAIPFSLAMQFTQDSVIDLLPAADENNAIIEKNGIFMIQDNLSISDVLLDPDFKTLVDSILKN